MEVNAIYERNNLDVVIAFKDALSQVFRTHDEHATYGAVEELHNQMIRGRLKQHLKEKKYGNAELEDLFLIGQAKLSI